MYNIKYNRVINIYFIYLLSFLNCDTSSSVELGGRRFLKISEQRAVEPKKVKNHCSKWITSRA